jgi:heme exporter protein C
MSRSKPGIRLALAGLVVTTITMVWALAEIFLYAPEEQVMGAVQKIFFFHVPAAFVTYFGVMVLLAASIGYLWTRNQQWDIWSRAATEASLLFCTLVLVSGPIWARPIWGTWWTWEARLTTTLILWILLAACLLVRRLADTHEQGARLAAVIGVLAALDIPIIHKAVEWWRGQHPQVFASGNKGSLAAEMRPAFLAGTILFFCLFFLFLTLRVRLSRLEDRTRELRERIWAEDAS